MNLPTLEAEFLKHSGDGSFKIVESLSEADGIWFLCPKCYADNNGPAGTHHVICWFKGKVPNAVSPGPGRWTPEGIGIADLSLTPSIQLPEPCKWHGFITKGDAA